MGLLDGCMGGVPGVLDFETVGKPGRDLGKLSWQIGQIGEYWPILAVLCDSHLLQAKSTCSD